MEAIYFVLGLLQSFGVSLGVGSSTLAVLNFFVAVRDGEVDPSERRLMQVVYAMLRVAMGIILITLFVQGVLLVTAYGTAYIHPFIVFVWCVVMLLYVNAVLMTKHLIPMTIGPALQATSWYTLAILYYLSSIDRIDFTYVEFIGGFAALFIVMLCAINGTVAILRLTLRRKQ